jgi:hypothetical protein
MDWQRVVVQALAGTKPVMQPFQEHDVSYAVTRKEPDMGRSYLSIGLAAIFGLLVAAVVAAAEHARPTAAPGVAVETHAAGTLVVLKLADEDARCDKAVTVLVRTPRARAHAPAAVGAGRI